MLGLGASAMGIALPGRAETPGLRDLAAASGLQFGSASGVTIADAPAAYATALVHNCGVFAPATPWRRMAGQDETVVPVQEDANITFALRHGMRLSGGNLLWHAALPADFASAPGGSVAQALAADHVDQTVGRYAGQAFSWNVVNQAIDAESPDGLRPSLLRERLGPDFIAAAFRIARAADRTALLVLNDGGFEMDTARHVARRATLLRLLDRLAREHASIDAVGLQTHVRLDGTRFDPALYQRFLRDIAIRGLRILITGMEVADIDVAGGVETRDDTVAATYRDVLSVALAEPAVVSLVTGGLSDRYAAAAASPQYRRADGLPLRPLPLDDQFAAKPAFAAIATVLRARI